MSILFNTWAGMSGGARESVRFDGAAYLSRVTPMTGAGNTPFITLSAWFKSSEDSTPISFLSENQLFRNFSFSFGSGGISISGGSGGGISRLQVLYNGSFSDGKWHHIYMSVDMTQASERFLVIDGAPVSASWTYPFPFTGGVEFGAPRYAIGAASVDGLSPYVGNLANLYVNALYSADSSAKFISGGRPVKRNVDGSFGAGTGADAQPLIWMTGDKNGFPVNAGSGGAFTLSGALLNGSRPVVGGV